MADWSQLSPNAGINPQVVFTGAQSGSGTSTFMAGKLGIASLQYELAAGGTLSSWVQGRLLGMNTFFTMSLTNASIGNNIQTTVTGSGLFYIAPAGGVGNIEFRPVVSAVSTSVAIAAGYTQG